MNRLKTAGYYFRNIPIEEKIDGATGIIYRERYNPSLVSKGRYVTFEFSQWQIKIGKITVNILIIYRPSYSRGGRLNNANMIMGDFNFHV